MVETLQTKITELEQQAGTLPTDTEDYYERLYGFLSEAYFAQKDIIELLQGNGPVVGDNASNVALSDAQDALQLLRSNYSLLETNIDIYKEEIKKLDSNLNAANNTLSQISVIINGS